MTTTFNLDGWLAKADSLCINTATLSISSLSLDYFCWTHHCLSQEASFLGLPFSNSLIGFDIWIHTVKANSLHVLFNTGLQTWPFPSTFHRMPPWMVCSLSSDLFVVRTMFHLVRRSENNMAEMSLYTGQSPWDCYVQTLAIGFQPLAPNSLSYL